MFHWHKISATWKVKDRVEKDLDCARRVLSMLEGLSMIHPLLDSWAFWNESSPMLVSATSHDRVLQALKEPIELGQANAAWFLRAKNGGRGFCQAELDLHCPIVDSDSLYRLIAENWQNRVDLTLPEYDVENASLVNFETLKATMGVMIDAWQPSVCVLHSGEFDYLSIDRDDEYPFGGGWMAYASGPYAALLDSPPPSEPFKDGILMVVTKDQFTILNPEHLSGAENLRRAFRPLVKQG